MTAATSTGPPSGTEGAATIRTPFGPIVPEPARAIHLANGLFGLPEAVRFQLEQVAGLGDGLMLMQCLDEAGLSFVVAPLAPQAGLIARADLEPARAALGIAPEDLVVLVIVTVARTPEGVRLFANLRAPVLVDSGARTGAQVVLADPRYPIRHPLAQSSAG